MKKHRLFWILPSILVFALAAAVWVRAQAPQPEPAASSEGKENRVDGISGRLEGLYPEQVQAMGGYIPQRYIFSGVADDGAKGVSGKRATSVICTNTSATITTNLVVNLFSSDGATYYSTTVLTLAASRTITVSTQATYLFLEDMNLSTNAISQGYGEVRSDSALVICSAMVLDPTGNPPAFVSELELFRR